MPATTVASWFKPFYANIPPATKVPSTHVSFENNATLFACCLFVAYIYGKFFQALTITITILSAFGLLLEYRPTEDGRNADNSWTAMIPG